MMKDAERARIVIVGGGPGGLTLARLLERQGIEAAVYERERDRHAHIQGSALDLHRDSGLAAMEAAGLMDGFWTPVRQKLHIESVVSALCAYTREKSNVRAC